MGIRKLMSSSPKAEEFPLEEGAKAGLVLAALKFMEHNVIVAASTTPREYSTLMVRSISSAFDFVNAMGVAFPLSVAAAAEKDRVLFRVLGAGKVNIATPVIVFSRLENARFAEGFADSILRCSQDVPGEKSEYARFLIDLVLNKILEDETSLPLLSEAYFSLAVKLLETVFIRLWTMK